MTREEAKKLLPFIQAFSEGKQIQWLKPDSDEWIDIVGGDNVDFEDLTEFNVAYRIKPEPKYRPFKNTEECWNEMQKHQPFGWLKPVNEYTKKVKAINISSIGDDDEYPIQFTHDYGDYSFEYLYKEFTFMDGTPFGIVEEE